MRTPQIRTLAIRVREFAWQFQYSMIAGVVLLSLWPSRALAQDGHSHTAGGQQTELTPAQKSKRSAPFSKLSALDRALPGSRGGRV